MATTTVRVKTKTHQALRERAKERGESLTDTLDHLVEEDRRQRMIEGAQKAWAALREDPEAWAEWQAEMALWDSTSADGLEDESDVEW
ncbi:MAG: toxin-antitoxin system protein [Chloroflexia bacterium]|nr:toxin-antitoxin system protein [Chloroflexia bacterium]